MNTVKCIANWSLVQEIGFGCSSVVKLGFNAAENTFAALKIAKSDSRVHKQALVNETNLLRKLSHPNIAKLIDSYADIDWEDERGVLKQVTAIAMELVPHGELSELVSKTGRLEEQIARYHFHQLLEVIQYCHSKGVVHRDIKPENLLLDADFNIKLVDFGFSKSLSNKSNMSVVGCLGTDAYMAPELYFRQPYDGACADVFAAGVVLFFMVAGHLPFSVADPKDQLYKLFINKSPASFWGYHEKEISKSNSGSSVSDEFKDLIMSLLAIDPEDRLSIDDIKKHPWMQGPVVSKEELKREFSQRSAIVQPIINQIVINKQDLTQTTETSMERCEQKASSPVQVSKKVVSALRPIDTTVPSVEKEKVLRMSQLAQITSPGLPNISLN